MENHEDSTKSTAVYNLVCYLIHLTLGWFQQKSRTTVYQEIQGQLYWLSIYTYSWVWNLFPQSSPGMYWAVYFLKLTACGTPTCTLLYMSLTNQWFFALVNHCLDTWSSSSFFAGLDPGLSYFPNGLSRALTALGNWIWRLCNEDTLSDYAAHNMHNKVGYI